ncbi:hypothetical protein KY285_019091 [Solanum tuberosum]|nr:hypothetical protein KY285_019091 [Solanum tuberosum]
MASQENDRPQSASAVKRKSKGKKKVSETTGTQSQKFVEVGTLDALGRLVIAPAGTIGFIPGFQSANAIMDSIVSCYRDAWSSWEEVPVYDREQMWNHFKVSLMEDHKVLKIFVDDSIRDSIKEMKDSISKDLAEFRSVLLEALGKNVTTSFQPPNTVMDAKLWQFRGENLEAWIVQVEHYFDFYNIEEDQKLTVASFYLDGEALDWYRWLFRNNQLIDWPHFAAKVRIRFKPKELESVRGSNITNSLLPQHYAKQSEFESNAGQVFDQFSDRSKGAILEPHKVRTMTKYTIETHFPTDPEHPIFPCDVANDYAVIVENKDKNKVETSLIIPIEDNVIVEFYPCLFAQLCLPLMPHDFRDLALCVSVKNGLTPCDWFDTGQHTSRPKHSLGMGCSQFATQNAGEPHPRVLGIKILEWLVGNQLRAARRQNKWMMLSSTSYFVCNNFTKALYILSPNTNFGWSMTLQPYSYFSPGFIVSLTFTNRPFDPGDKAHVSDLVTSWVMYSPSEYARLRKGAKAYTTVVFGKSLLALEQFVSLRYNFRTQCAWYPQHEYHIFCNFEINAAFLLNKTLESAWEMNQKPDWMLEGLWARLIEKRTTEKFQKPSIQAKAPPGTHQRKLEKKKRRTMTYDEISKERHVKNKKNGHNTLVESHVERTNAGYKKGLDEWRQSQPTSEDDSLTQLPDDDEASILSKKIGGLKKGKARVLGSEHCVGCVTFGFASASLSSGQNQEEIDSEIKSLRIQVQELLKKQKADRLRLDGLENLVVQLIDNCRSEESDNDESDGEK